MLRGRVPLISLYEISNSSKANNLPKESGNAPEMELEGRFITSKDDRLPIESGIRPEIELDPSSRVCKDDKFPNEWANAGEREYQNMGSWGSRL
ncbi:hypothetical protein E3N88_12969 [Mikania micrantha]|uniref:Uncharacterized protein n=1 Tax=Mikania micrantha TaxID=192012 RepID=A0A5N6P760_9ASTR|nr:hypothetical protein E3N88_12969 [Mikania micrantha]